MQSITEKQILIWKEELKKHREKLNQAQVNNYFKRIGNITIVSIKLYYLELFSQLKDNWDEIYKIVNENKLVINILDASIKKTENIIT